MVEKFDSLVSNYYRVRTDPQQAPRLEQIPGANSLKLSLVLQDHPNLERALATPPLGAILAVDMSMEQAAHIYAQIADAALQMGYTLPVSTGNRGGFQTTVSAEMRKPKEPE